MARSFQHIRTLFGEFVLLVLAVTLLSVVAAFHIFDGLGQAALNRSLVLALAVPLISAVPYSIYFMVRLTGLMQHNDGLQRAATTDRLTGVLNRPGFDVVIRRHMAALGSHQYQGLMLLIVDADHFKRINDRLGHPVGDKALKAIAGALKRSMRGSDAVGRMGGEEFAISFPCTSLEQGRAVAERLRLSIGKLSVSDGRQSAQLSVSIGGAFYTTPQLFDRVYGAADVNLYHSKRNGRNRTTITSVAAHGRRYLQAEQPAVAQLTSQPAR
ncbi:GGDEF domain-containing protein [Aurantimonas sp. A2-1-M11]|uniref:GGDEF domain-containing protein n=1 Tax=Aurantimonas sp. A2-1-M11 TaxID=3113712 RepID=UPI002F93281C